VNELGAAAVYLLCLATSVVCALLVARAWRRTGSRLLLWTALSFAFLALNNLLVVADMVVFPTVDFWIWRQAAAGAALTVLLYGFIAEAR
jgi:uncharacterized membrane protein